MTIVCRTVLNYLPAAGAWSGDRSNDVEILDGRKARLPGWEECGFELMSHGAGVKDWADEAVIGSDHHAEMEDLARKLSGADVALVSSHIRRSPQDARRHHQLSPIHLVHSDFAAGHDQIIRRTYREGPETAPALERNGIAAKEAEEARRILVLQFWRNLGPAKMDFPLAFCDARTVRPTDGRAFHVSDYAGSGVSFDALAVAAPDDPSRHRWYSFPQMQSDEVVAFRTYDTDMVERGETYFTPHSAFRDPDVPVGRPSRVSIELRAHCLWL
jgi:hypothetical protein